MFSRVLGINTFELSTARTRKPWNLPDIERDCMKTQVFIYNEYLLKLVALVAEDEDSSRKEEGFCQEYR